MKTQLIFLLLTICLISCSKNAENLNSKEIVWENVNQSNAANTVDSTPNTEKTNSKTENPVPKIVNFEVRTFFRHSEKDEIRETPPPYSFGEISFFSQTTKIKIGDSITAIPLQIDRENLTLKVKSLEKMKFLDCDAEKMGSEVEFAPITDKNLLEIKAVDGRGESQPFDMFLIYPAVEAARKMKQTELTQKMLPQSVKVNQVVIAIDLNGDNTPDLLVSSYCCYDSSQCDCTQNFKKVNSEWKYLGGSEPC